MAELLKHPLRGISYTASLDSWLWGRSSVVPGQPPVSGELIEAAAEDAEEIPANPENGEGDDGADQATARQDADQAVRVEPGSPPPAPERRHAPVEGPGDVAGQESRLDGAAGPDAVAAVARDRDPPESTRRQDQPGKMKPPYRVQHFSPPILSSLPEIRDTALRILLSWPSPLNTCPPAVSR